MKQFDVVCCHLVNVLNFEYDFEKCWLVLEIISEIIKA